MIQFKPGKYRRRILFLWRGFGIGLALLIFYIAAVNYNFFWLFGGMPDLKALENPKSEIASELISQDGKSLGKYLIENRSPVEISEISPNLINALVATEDTRFISHSGIDPRSLLRVAKGILTGNSSSGGGSTLTQQVAKNLFNTRSEEFEGTLSKIPGVRIVIARTPSGTDRALSSASRNVLCGSISRAPSPHAKCAETVPRCGVARKTTRRTDASPPLSRK